MNTFDELKQFLDNKDAEYVELVNTCELWRDYASHLKGQIDFLNDKLSIYSHDFNRSVGTIAVCENHEKILSILDKTTKDITAINDNATEFFPTISAFKENRNKTE